MRQTQFIFLLWCVISSIGVQAQTIVGRVVDKDSQKPLINVEVRNASKPIFVSFTDTAGYFRIESLPDNIIEISHLGFASTRLQARVFNKHQTIFLEPRLVTLPEVVITAMNNNVLLEKGIEKLKNKLAVESTELYLWHGFDESLSTSSTVESYAEYTATLHRKKNKITQDLYLQQLKHVLKKNIESSVVMSNNLYDVQFHPDDITTSNKHGSKIVKKEEADSIILTYYPIHNKDGAVHIIHYVFSKKDTTLQAIYGYSVDSLCQQQKYTRVKKGKFKTIGQQFGLIFENVKGIYYLKQCYHSAIAVFDINGQQETVRSINTTSWIKNSPPTKSKGKKISGWSGELLKKEDDATSDFWQQYLKE